MPTISNILGPCNEGTSNLVDESQKNWKPLGCFYPPFLTNKFGTRIFRPLQEGKDPIGYPIIFADSNGNRDGRKVFILEIWWKMQRFQTNLMEFLDLWDLKNTGSPRWATKKTLGPLLSMSHPGWFFRDLLYCFIIIPVSKALMVDLLTARANLFMINAPLKISMPGKHRNSYNFFKATKRLLVFLGAPQIDGN